MVTVAGFDEAHARAALTTMLERLTKGPFVTLGIDSSATFEDVRHAFLTLTKTYHPAKFARMSVELHKQSNEVFLGIRAAHDTIAKSLPKPVKRTPPQRHATPPQGLEIEGAGRATPARGLASPANARSNAPSPAPAVGSSGARSSSPSPAPANTSGRPAQNAPMTSSGRSIGSNVPSSVQAAASSSTSASSSSSSNTTQSFGRIAPNGGPATARLGSEAPPAPSRLGSEPPRPANAPSNNTTTNRAPLQSLSSALSSTTPTSGSNNRPGTAGSNNAPGRPLAPPPSALRPRTPSNGGMPNDPPTGTRPVLTPPVSNGSGPRPIIPAGPKAPTPAFGVRVPVPGTSTNHSTAKNPIVTPLTPSFDETAELAAGQDMLRRGDWKNARMKLQALSSRVPGSKQYHAMLSYAKAKENPTTQLVAMAIAELERLVQADPTQMMAKAALADLRHK